MVETGGVTPPLRRINMGHVIKSFVLFLLIFKIGAVSFGGAYSIWALTEQNFVDGNPEILSALGESLPREKFNEILEINRLTPGPNINVVLLVGEHYLGVGGVAIAFVALLLPSALAIVGLYKINQRVGFKDEFNSFKLGALAAVTGIFISFIVTTARKIPHETLTEILVFGILTVLLFVLIHFKRVNIVIVTLFGAIMTWGFWLIWGKIV